MLWVSVNSRSDYKVYITIIVHGNIMLRRTNPILYMLFDLHIWFHSKLLHLLTLTDYNIHFNPAYATLKLKIVKPLSLITDSTVEAKGTPLYGHRTLSSRVDRYFFAHSWCWCVILRRRWQIFRPCYQRRCTGGTSVLFHDRNEEEH